MKQLDPTTELNLLIFSVIARSGLVKCAGDATQLSNKVIQLAQEQGFKITKENSNVKAA